jgi:hypothetical protein
MKTRDKSVRDRPPQLTDEIVAALDATGRPWEVTKGGSHYVVRLDGKVATILSYAPRTARHRFCAARAIQQIRRAARQLDQQERGRNHG